MKVLLPEETELQGFEKNLKTTLEQAKLAGYALMGFQFREALGSKLHEIDALVVMEPGVFVCLEAKGYKGKWTGSANERWFSDTQEIKAVGGNPYKQVERYSLVIKDKLQSRIFRDIKFWVNYFVVAPDETRFDVEGAAINTFQPGKSVSICHVSKIEQVLGSIRTNEEVAAKFNEVGIKKIISELIGISLEELEKIIIAQSPEPSISVETTPEQVTEPPPISVETTPEKVTEPTRTNKSILLTCLIGLGILVTTGGTWNYFWNKRPCETATETRINGICYKDISKKPIEEKKIEVTTLTIGILSNPSYYQELTNYLRSQFGNKVQIVIDGDESISYEEARKRMINKEWDIAFTLSPILSVAAKNNDYHFAARMFPNNPPYYQATLFTKSTSSIKSLNDLKTTNTIALGDFNSASSFYVPAYDLFGKSLRVDMGHRSKDIKDLVKTGKADIGAGAYEAVASDKDLKIIHLSKQIPGANVYLSSKLSESDRQIITKVLLNAPDNIRKKANYSGGEEHDYSQLIKISQRTEEILKCANFQRNPVNFYCSDSSPEPKPSISPDTSEILGRVNGWSRQTNEIETFKLSGKDNTVYQIIVPRKILNQISGASNPIALQGKEVKITNVAPQKAQGGMFELKITEPNQLNILEDIPKSSIQSNYQVKQVDDGDTITVTDVSNQEIRVRFACIDTAEVPHSDTEKNSNNPADTNQFLWGNKAKERLKTLIQKGGSQVQLNIVDTDFYGRKVAEVRLPDNTLTQQILVKEGLAMVYRKYLKNCPSAGIVEQAEDEAKQQGLNIWADSQFTAPWYWRSQKKSSKKS